MLLLWFRDAQMCKFVRFYPFISDLKKCLKSSTKRMGEQTVGDCVDNEQSESWCRAVSWLFNRSASASSRLFVAVQTQYSAAFDRWSASQPQLVHANHSTLADSALQSNCLRVICQWSDSMLDQFFGYRWTVIGRKSRHNLSQLCLFAVIYVSRRPCCLKSVGRQKIDKTFAIFSLEDECNCWLVEQATVTSICCSLFMGTKRQSVPVRFSKPVPVSAQRRPPTC